jgi:hypothetical protein
MAADVELPDNPAITTRHRTTSPVPPRLCIVLYLPRPGLDVVEIFE